MRDNAVEFLGGEPVMVREQKLADYTDAKLREVVQKLLRLSDSGQGDGPDSRSSVKRQYASSLVHPADVARDKAEARKTGVDRVDLVFKNLGPGPAQVTSGQADTVGSA